jgi:DNA polymerase phi
MLLADKKKKKDRKSKELSEDLTDEPVDILVDTIIGFLEKSTAYLRTVGNQGFSLLSGSVKNTTIDLILAVSYFHLYTVSRHSSLLATGTKESITTC